MNEPLAQAVMRHLADTRGKDDPLGSLARSVLSGESTLRGAVRSSWYGEGLATAAADGLRAQDSFSFDQRAAVERDAARLRSRSDTADPTSGGDQ
ncbi:hypothetical protein FB565_002982 [Actinoplanes lutulentus]|nr:hypothetical protein [Actinoplanes lutulentus]MBB2943269.1 hypothetical protein [Actinoplanes lutulentus]